MLSESLRVPFRAGDWIGTILVGSTLTLLGGLLGVGWLVVVGVVVSMVTQVGWLMAAMLTLLVGLVGGLLVFLPSLVLRGYLLGVVRSAIRGEPTVESFVGWGSLVRDGSRSTLISAVYLLPAAMCGGLAVGAAIAPVVSPAAFERPLQAIAALGILGGGFGLLLYGLVYLSVRPAARAVFGSTGSVRAALDVRRVVRLSTTADYITGWLIGMGILVVGPTLLFPLLILSLASAVVSPALAFIGVLSTILLGIATVFLCRVSAAYATGMGSTQGLTTLYPAAVERADQPPAPTPPLIETTPSEAAVTVQTGRTVEDTDSTSAVADLPVEVHEGELSGAPVYPRHADNGATVRNDDESTDIDQADSESETDPAEASSTDDELSADNEDEFIWGPPDE